MLHSCQRVAVLETAHCRFVMCSALSFLGSLQSAAQVEARFATLGCRLILCQSSKPTKCKTETDPRKSESMFASVVICLVLAHADIWFNLGSGAPNETDNPITGRVNCGNCNSHERAHPGKKNLRGCLRRILDLGNLRHSLAAPPCSRVYGSFQKIRESGSRTQKSELCRWPQVCARTATGRARGERERGLAGCRSPH